jgi:hypothetical protein
LRNAWQDVTSVITNMPCVYEAIQRPGLGNLETFSDNLVLLECENQLGSRFIRGQPSFNGPGGLLIEQTPATRWVWTPFVEVCWNNLIQVMIKPGYWQSEDDFEKHRDLGAGHQ